MTASVDRIREMQRALESALVLAATEFAESDLRGLQFDSEAAHRLASDLAAATRPTTPAHQIASRALVQVSRSSVLKVSSAPTTRRVAVEGALILADTLLRRRGLRLRPDLRASVARLLSTEPLARDALRKLLQRAVTERRARPALVLLTPLSQLPNDAAQRRLLAVADRLDETAALSKYRILVPGRTLHPDDLSDRPPDQAESERRLILGAARIMVIAAEHDSWGAAKCVAWAESVGIPVTVYTTRPDQLSRVLAHDTPQTTYVPFTTVDEVADDIVRRVVGEGPPGPALERRLRRHARLEGPQHSLRTSLDTSTLGRLGLRLAKRVDAAADCADEALSLTLAETLDLAEVMPGPVRELISGLFSLPDTEAARSKRVLEADQLDGLDVNMLQYFCKEHDVGTQEMLSMLSLMRDDTRLAAGWMRGERGLRYLRAILDRVRRRA